MDRPPAQVVQGEPERAVPIMQAAGCSVCHVIPGVQEARGRVGPSLEGFGDRRLISGTVVNNGDNLVAWLLDPQSIDPDTAMPDTGLTEDQARDVAAYLLSLEA